MGSCTQSGRRTSRSLISRHRALRTAAVTACWSPLAMAASMARTSLSRPGKSTPGLAGSFMALILAQAVEEAPDGWAEAGEVDQEGVVALRGVQRQEAGIGAAGAQAFGDLLLLLQREQDVGGDADRQRLVHADAGQCPEHVAALVAAGRDAVLGRVEPVHRAAPEQVAV